MLVKCPHCGDSVAVTRVDDAAKRCMTCQRRARRRARSGGYERPAAGDILPHQEEA